MYDIIAKKRDGGTLTRAEIAFGVNGYVDGSVPDYQMSALLMAIYLRGMTDAETAELTDVMAHSGDMVDLSAIQGIKADKHSTGGVGDKTTLVIAPIVAACGVKIAKMSGRGLGHTGGTIDKMESVPGTRTSLTQEEFFKQVNEIGISVIGQSGKIAVADKKLYALRDVTATVGCIPLIASSIMSKKLAAGSDAILLDVTMGSGAFMKNLDEAVELARLMVSIGTAHGRKVAALITDMDTPLGHNIGNSLEVAESMAVLQGKGPADLTEVCLQLASNMLYLAGKGEMAALSPKTKAVMIAHTLGNPFDLSAVKAFCDAHNLWLVEDNCDALGTQYTINGETRFTGTWGDIGTSSFYPPHHMTMGEGGCVYTNSPLLNRLIKSYRDWGRDCICPSGHDNFCGHRFDGQYGELPAGYDHKYVYSHFGYNLKVTDMQAAIGCEQLKKFPSFIERRRHNWDRLRAALEPAADKLILPEPAANSRPSWFGFLISVKPESGLDRNAVTRYIEDHNVQTRLLFSGNLIKHPCFDQIRGTDAYRVAGELTNTDFIMNNTFWVGVYPGMTDEMIDYMAKIIIEAVNQ